MLEPALVAADHTALGQAVAITNALRTTRFAYELS